MKTPVSVTKIVITGGPCAGKTSALKHIRNTFSERGYRVVMVAETATELIASGILPESFESIAGFQRILMQLQYEKERIVSRAVNEQNNSDPVLLIFDRGLADGKAYLSEEEYHRALSSVSLSQDAVLQRYDGIFHLVTTANGACEFYTLANNPARTEPSERAIELDRRVIAAWTGHPYFRVIDNSTDFAGKIERLLAEITKLLEQQKKQKKSLY